MNESEKGDGDKRVADRAAASVPGRVGPLSGDERLQGATDDQSRAPIEAAANAVVAQGGAPALGRRRFPHDLGRQLGLFLGNDGRAYAEICDRGNRYCLAVSDRGLDNRIRAIAQDDGVALRRADLNDLNAHLQAQAEMAGPRRSVWLRVAEVPGGVEIDAGDEQQTRFRVTAGRVEIVTHGSTTLFYRSPVMRPFVMPAARGDLSLLDKYINMAPPCRLLFTGYLTYDLGHPKTPATTFPLLLLMGEMGSGKSSLCENVVIPLVDPSVVGVQLLPRSAKDLAVAARGAHVLCFDNVRQIPSQMADVLCVAATGGALSTRALYTNADVHIDHLHAAIVLNSIHSPVNQSDFAQRCVPLSMLRLSDGRWRSEADLRRELAADLPRIFRGLLDRIASIFEHLPRVEVVHPERLIDFVKWLGAMELADGIPHGPYQAEFSDALLEAQRDSLQENVLAAMVLEFAEGHVDRVWSGTPAELLAKLNELASRGTQRSRDWPPNEISLSLRLAPLAAGLATQGVSIAFSRGRTRTITITRQEASK